MQMAHLLCPLSKYKQHSVNNIGLAASIGPHHRGEALQAIRAVSTIQFSQVTVLRKRQAKPLSTLWNGPTICWPA